MCGIFGLVGPEQRLSDADLQRARYACDALLHRGPDQYGEWVAANIYLGHRRLSILDLSDSGRQPMVSGDGAVAVAVNGEIYNFRTLRDELGVDLFKSGSDSEVILHGYEAWGIEGLLARIEGMFAFSVIDRRLGKVYLARDHFGIKPLYYGEVDGHIFWCSELKAAKRCFGSARMTTDRTALYDFLTYRYVPAPKTLYRECHKLEAAHYLEINLHNRQFVPRRYWQLPASEAGPGSAANAVEELRSLVGRSVESQLVSDVPLGFFLSGGIDSSVVVAEAAREHGDLNTFTIGYDHAAHDETGFAALVASHYTTRHHQRILAADAMDDLFARMEDWYDEPFADTSALPTYQVAALARERVTTVLTGDGGDELFGGYRWYQRFARFRRAQGLLGAWGGRGPSTSLAAGRTGFRRKVLSRLDLWSRFDPLDLYATLLSGYIRAEKQDYRAELEIEPDYDDMWHFRRYYRPDLPIRKRLQYLDFHTYLPDDILTKVDRATMAVSLEARVPLLSRPIAEFAFSLPESVLYANGRLKGLLKQAYEGELPSSILHRGKKGFSIPIHQWDSGLQEDIRAVQARILQRHRAQPDAQRSPGDAL